MPTVKLSLIGNKMSSMSGLRSIMEDIATSTAQSGGARWLNLSIGNPAPIPEVIAMWQGLTEQALVSGFAEASCQYGPSRGVPPLVRALADYFNQRYAWGIGAENIIVGPGSQMLCFIAAALYAGPSASGRTQIVLPMLPDYTGYQSLCMNPGGITGIDSVVEKEDGRYFRYAFDQEAVERHDNMGMMLLSSPSNPTGRCVDASELARLISVVERRDVPLILDHAYGEPFPRIGQTLTPPGFHPNVINCFSLSKAGLPGERVGFAIGHERYITPMVSFLANSALHASRLAQTAIAVGLDSGEIDRLVSSVIKPFYAVRWQMAEKLLHDTMPSTVNWRLYSSEGGMFCWVWIDEDWFDDLTLYQRLKLRHVFVAPGRNFFTDVPHHLRRGSHSTQCFRITLTAPEEVLAKGIRRISETVAELRAAGDAPPPAPGPASASSVRKAGRH
jgi:valine--pyruvate aminotransferase